MKKTILLILALLGLLLVAASPLLAPDIIIDWWAIGPGSRPLSNAGIELHGMIGQGAAGQVSQAGTDLCAGYLCITLGQTRAIFLPMIVK